MRLPPDRQYPQIPLRWAQRAQVWRYRQVVWDVGRVQVQSQYCADTSWGAYWDYVVVRVHEVGEETEEVSLDASDQESEEEDYFVELFLHDHQEAEHWEWVDKEVLNAGV